MKPTEIRDVTLEATRIVSERLRAPDEVELRLLTSKPPYEALVESVAASRYSKCLYLDGEPAALFGVGELSEGVGVPWMMGTEALTRHSREWLRIAPQMRDFFHKHYPVLTNIVHLKNTQSIRWLARLGFSFDQTPIPGLPGFIQFTRTHNV